MPRPKIKVVRCAKCKKRYGAMVAYQKCPHCAKARKARGTKRKNPLRLTQSEAKKLGLVETPSKVTPIRRAPTPRKGTKRHTTKGLFGPARVGKRLGRAVRKVKRSTSAIARGFRFGVRNPKPAMTYKLAMAAGQDAANRQMRKAGRSAWSRADYNLAAKTFHRLYGSKRANPSGTHLFKKFHGMRSTKTVQVRTSKAMPASGSWVLGPLNYLKVRKGNKIQKVDFGPRARLVGYGKRLLAIGNAQFKQHRGVNPSEHGLVPVELGYEKRAPHLNDGYTGLTPWKHRFGEESGRMPCLHIDHEGFAIIKGGGFHIKADGIHD